MAEGVAMQSHKRLTSSSSLRFSIVFAGSTSVGNGDLQPQHSLSDISTYYRSKKRRRSDSNT